MKKKNLMEKEIAAIGAKILFGIGAVLALDVIAGAVMSHFNMKKIKSKQGQSNYSHFNTLGKAKLNIDNKTDNAYLSCLTGELDVTLSKPKADMCVEITAVMACVKIHIPSGVQVSYSDASSEMKKDTDAQTKLPEIRFCVNSIASNVEFLDAE